MEIVDNKMDLSTIDVPIEKHDKKEVFLKPPETIGILYSNPIFKYSDLSLEDSGTFLGNFFRGKETNLKENWDTNETIQAKILNFDDYEVYVDCLIDSENSVVQSRKFPITLFKSLPQIKEGKPVLIKTRLKPGAIRIDIYPGEGIVKMEAFEINDNWESLRGKNLDVKLEKW